MLCYGNVDLGQVSDSDSSDPDQIQVAKKHKKLGPMSMRCAEYLGDTLMQDFLEMNKASQEITAHMAYLMAHSLHIYGARWQNSGPESLQEAIIMHTLLEGWSKAIKAPNLHVVYFNPHNCNFSKEDLHHLALSCMMPVDPEIPDLCPQSLRPENGFTGMLQLQISPNEKETYVNMVNHAGNTVRYVFNEMENGALEVIDKVNEWTTGHSNRMEKMQGGHASWVKANAKNSIEQYRTYLHTHAKTSQLPKGFPSYLLNFDNLKYNSIAKTSSTVKLPPIYGKNKSKQYPKPLSELNWIERQLQKMNVKNGYLFGSDGSNNAQYVDTECYIRFHCIKKHKPTVEWNTHTLESILKEAAEEMGNLKLWDNPSLFELHVWQTHWLPELYAMLHGLHTKDVLDNARIHLGKLRNAINKCVIHYRTPMSNFLQRDKPSTQSKPNTCENMNFWNKKDIRTMADKNFVIPFKANQVMGDRREVTDKSGVTYVYYGQELAEEAC